MTEYYIPSGRSEAEFTEKRSRFIGCVFPVSSEAGARSCIEEIKKKYYDARHHCWCYRLKEEGIERCSDGGEPQGTAGQPMLAVFQREEVFDVCCVVTRYFGGVLLGAGGLVRAYAKSAKDALDAAGLSVVRPWMEVAASCPYALFERAKQEIMGAGGIVKEVEYAADVTIYALLPEETVAHFQDRMVELTSGSCTAYVVGQVLRSVPLCPA